jgi:predicted lipoprotein with Yx(FWY)xxD motif
MAPNTTKGIRAGSRIAALAAVGILALAACSASGSGAVAGATSAPAATAAAAAAAAGGDYGGSVKAADTPMASAAAAGTVYTVAAAKDAVAGPYLTGENGMTLYVFKKDTGSTSACYDQCATNWPPFVLEGTESVKAGDGVTGTFATTKRTDGAMQVTYNGAPLYYFAADKKAGDVTGQGVGGIWFVAAP